MTFLNNTCTYAIRAVLQVAAEQPAAGTFVSTRKIADELDVPFAFLTKVLQGLTQSGILHSQRGATGGVALSRPAESITLLDIVAAVGSDSVFRGCVLGLPKCSDVAPCALHERWLEQRSQLEDLFARTTLAELAGQGASKVPFEDPTPASSSRNRGRSTRRAT
jgi:Rrf2 family iron-sulfur cluster assembly transcriptional regulator